MDILICVLAAVLIMGYGAMNNMGNLTIFYSLEFKIQMDTLNSKL